jgi:hypothetical protein
MSILDPVPGASYDAEGKIIEKTVEEPVVPPAGVDTVPATVPPPAQPVVTTTVSADINWETVLAEKTGGKVKSWEEIESRLNAEPQQPISFANDEAKKVFEHLSQGKIEDVLQVYNEQRRLANLDKMGDVDAVKLLMEYKNPNFTSEDINDELSTKYQAEKPEEPSEDDYIDDDAFSRAQKQYTRDLAKYEKDQKRLDRQLKLDANNAREQLTGYKKDIILPDINPSYAPSQEDLDKQKAFEENHKAAREAYLTSLKKTASEFKEIPFEFSDEGVVFKGSYQIDDAERLTLENDLANKHVIDDILLPRYDKGGVYDTRQLMEDIYFLNNREKIIKAAVKQAIAQTSLDNLKALKNIDLDQQQRGVVDNQAAEAQRANLVSAFMTA